MHDRVTASGGASRPSVYDDVVHGWQLLSPWVPEARAALREAADFVTLHLQRAAASQASRPLS